MPMRKPPQVPTATDAAAPQQYLAELKEYQQDIEKEAKEQEKERQKKEKEIKESADKLTTQWKALQEKKAD